MHKYTCLSILGFRTYRDACFRSVHYFLVSKLRLRFKKFPKKKVLIAVDVTKLCDNEVRQQNQPQLTNRFGALSNTEHLEGRWANFKNAVMRQLKIQVTRDKELGRSNGF